MLICSKLVCISKSRTWAYSILEWANYLWKLQILHPDFTVCCWKQIIIFFTIGERGDPGLPGTGKQWIMIMQCTAVNKSCIHSIAHYTNQSLTVIWLLIVIKNRFDFDLSFEKRISNFFFVLCEKVYSSDSSDDLNEYLVKMLFFQNPFQMEFQVNSMR